MKNHNPPKGFTLLEVLVALSLLIIIFGGAISLIILINESQKSNKNNLIASYLAKEGQELVRYTRDKNYLQALPPFTNIATTTEDGAVLNFIIDFSGALTKVTTTDVKQVAALKIDNNNYSNTGTTNSIFKRLITTTYHKTSLVKPDYLDVKVEVYWREDTKQNTYTLTSQLIDWR